MKYSPNLDEHLLNILDYVRDNRERFMRNPRALGCYMVWWDALFYAGRAAYGYNGFIERNKYSVFENNPKYVLERVTDNVDEEYGNLVYAAWATALRYHDRKIGPFFLSERQFQTADDEIWADFPEAYYVSDEWKIKDATGDWAPIRYTVNEWQSVYKKLHGRMFPKPNDVIAHLLFTIGNGMMWSEDGYIVESTGDLDSSLFANLGNAYRNVFREEDFKTAFRGRVIYTLFRDVRIHVRKQLHDYFIKEADPVYLTLNEIFGNHKCLDKRINWELITPYKLAIVYNELQKSMMDDYLKKNEVKKRASISDYLFKQEFRCDGLGENIPDNAHKSYVLSAISYAENFVGDAKAEEYVANLRNRFNIK